MMHDEETAGTTAMEIEPEKFRPQCVESIEFLGSGV